PAGESLYFGNRRTRAGAVLADDARCGSAAAGGARLEEARLPSPVPGRYRVGVDFIDACGAAVDAVAFRVTVGRSPRQREVVSVIRPGEFAVVVLELELSEDGTVLEGAAPSAPGTT